MSSASAGSASLPDESLKLASAASMPDLRSSIDERCFRSPPTPDDAIQPFECACECEFCASVAAHSTHSQAASGADAAVTTGGCLPHSQPLEVQVTPFGCAAEQTADEQPKRFSFERSGSPADASPSAPAAPAASARRPSADTDAIPSDPPPVPPMLPLARLATLGSPTEAEAASASANVARRQALVETLKRERERLEAQLGAQLRAAPGKLDHATVIAVQLELL